MMRKAAVFVLAIVMLAGCASGPAINATEARRLEQGTPQDAKGRIYVYAYRNFMNSFRLTVDGIAVGDFGPGQAIAMDLVPGHYSAQLQVKTVWGTLSDPQKVEFDLVADQKLYVAQATYAGPVAAGGAAGYLIGSLLQGNNNPNHSTGIYFEVRQDADEVEGKDFVAPDPNAIAKINAKN
ncbi:MAG TPA: hypothetical protein VGH02_02080 [Rhizomicrobium sp.]|jgi:hypothetical protein